MSRLILELSISLDGVVAGPDTSPAAPLGRNGERLHEWMFAGKTPAESQRYELDRFSGIGALILGRRMADVGIALWGEEPTFRAPCFVVTRRPAETIVKAGGTSYTFVTEGIEFALEQAKQAAGSKHVLIGGGPSVVQQYLAAGLVDEFELHVVPVLLGTGERLLEGVGGLELEQVRAIEGPGVTHLRYRVVERAG